MENSFPKFAASIHAPARGATTGFLRPNHDQRASIHAPARGATRHAQYHQKPDRLQSTLPHGERQEQIDAIHRAQRFNPRSRTGSDNHHQGGRLRRRASIHAPARGATRGFVRKLCRPGSFNPRSRTGSDCGPFLPLPRNDIQGIFRAGHVSRSIYAINKSALKNYRNKIILLKNREPPRKMLCASGSRGLLPAAHRVPFSQSDIC